MTFVQQLKIDKRQRYDFESRIMGTKITMSIYSPFYIIILLAGIVFNITDSIF